MSAAAPSVTAVPAAQQTFLALDFGLKRTGVAVGNRMLRQAQPRPTIRAEGDARFDKVAALLPSKTIFDGRNLYKCQTMAERGFAYHSVGRAPTARQT